MSQLDVSSSSTPTPLLEITADRAITLSRWWLRLGAAFNLLMMAAIIATISLGARHGFGSLFAVIAAGVWLGVLFVSVRARRLAIDAAPLIAAGEFGLAEDRLSQSMRAFSVLRSTRLLGLQQLALLRHSQNNWRDVAKLCRELIDRQRSGERALDLPSRLMLTEALIELGDWAAASREIAVLSTRRLRLRDTLILTLLRLEVQVAAGQYAAAFAGAAASMTLIELMPPAAAARGHALLALAAKHEGASAWHAFFARRATLLADVETLVSTRPFLRDAFVGGSAADSSGSTR